MGSSVRCVRCYRMRMSMLLWFILKMWCVWSEAEMFEGERVDECENVGILIEVIFSWQSQAIPWIKMHHECVWDGGPPIVGPDTRVSEQSCTGSSVTHHYNNVDLVGLQRNTPPPRGARRGMDRQHSGQEMGPTLLHHQRNHSTDCKSLPAPLSP